MSDTPTPRLTRAGFLKGLAALPVVGSALFTAACQASSAENAVSNGARLPQPIDPLTSGPGGFALPELPYPPNALEAAIDTTTMQIHHGKHHAGYVRNLNTALEGQTGVSGLSAEAVIQNLNTLPNSIQTAVRNNGGGAVNHAIFWKTMSPDGGGAPTGALADALNTTFGSTDGFKQEFSAAARTCFGSGWAWLAVKPTGTLAIYHLPNQDSPYMQGDIPLLGLDVWEHAYYLRYQNRRGDYINNFWKVVNWPEVGKRMTQAKAAFA